MDDASIYSGGEKLGFDGILQTLDKLAASGWHFLGRRAKASLGCLCQLYLSMSRDNDGEVEFAPRVMGLWV